LGSLYAWKYTVFLRHSCRPRRRELGDKRAVDFAALPRLFAPCCCFGNFLPFTSLFSNNSSFG
jgi:hypothetical protein